MAELEKREGDMTNKVETENSEKIKMQARRVFLCFSLRFFLFHFIVHPFALSSGSAISLLLVSSFPSLLFTSLLHDLQSRSLI